MPLLANLGGSPLSPAAAAALGGCPQLIVQTNVDDAGRLDAPRRAAELASPPPLNGRLSPQARLAPWP